MRCRVLSSCSSDRPKPAGREGGRREAAAVVADGNLDLVRRRAKLDLDHAVGIVAVAVHNCVGTGLREQQLEIVELLSVTARSATAPIRACRQTIRYAGWEGTVSVAMGGVCVDIYW
jgi:hypothetical protein